MDPLRTRFAAGVLCRLIEDGCKTSVLCFLNLTVSLDLHAKIGLQHLFRAYSLKSVSYTHLVRLDLVDRNVADIVERPKKTPYIPRYYSLEEANELLDKLWGHWLWLPVMLCLFYGLRRSEVLGLSLIHI